jgi:hypothetical protein
MPTSSVHQRTAETVAPSYGENPKYGTTSPPNKAHGLFASSSGVKTNTLHYDRLAAQNPMIVQGLQVQTARKTFFPAGIVAAVVNEKFLKRRASTNDVNNPKQDI